MSRLTQKIFQRALEAQFARRFGKWGGTNASNQTTLSDMSRADIMADSSVTNHYPRRAASFNDNDDIEIYRVDYDNVLRIGGEAITPMMSSETFYLAAPSGTPNQTIFLAMFPCKIQAIQCEFGTANGVALTAQITKETAVQAPAAGTAVMSNTFNLNATANTVQSATLPDLSATSAPTRDLIFLNTGDRLSIKFSGAITSLATLAITVHFNPGSKGHVAFYRMSANGSIATQSFFLANTSMTIQGASATWGTAGTAGGAVTADLVVDTSTTAPGSGTSALSAALSLKTTANTVTAFSLSATAANLNMSPGNRLSFKLTGTPTSLANLVIAVWFLPIYKRKEVTFTMNANGGMVTTPFFVADQDYEVIDASEVHGTLGTDGGNVNLAVEVDNFTTAPGSGLISQTDNSNRGFNLKSTINTVQEMTPALLSLRILPKGGRLTAKFAGVQTSVAGLTMTVSLRPQS